MRKRKKVLFGWWQNCGMLRWYPNEQHKDTIQFIPLPTRCKKDLHQLVGFGYGARKVKITIEEI